MHELFDRVSRSKGSSESSLIAKKKEQWFEMASAGDVVDIFDTSTWNSNNFEPLLDLVHNMIVPHVLPQQRYKNRV